MIKLVVFDLDDTLYNERDFVFGAFREVCIYLASKYLLDEEEIYSEMLKIFYNQGRGKIFNVLCDKYLIDEDIDSLINIYRNAKPNINLYNDAFYTLQELKHKNIKIGIITDGKASVQWSKIEILKLNALADKIIVTDDYGIEYWKPHKFLYETMLKHFEYKPCEALYVGDNPHKDFIGAKALGYKTLRIIRDTGDHMKTTLDKNYEADYNIKDLREVFKYI